MSWRWLAAIGLAAGATALIALPDWDRAADLRVGAAVPPADDPAAVQRGEYLARVGHCAGCHTARGGLPYAGGRVIGTPFGAVVSANLTPDAETGTGRWTALAFRRALADGRSADGRALLPACPYPNFSLISAADADDLWAFLRSLPAQRQARAAHELRFPYDLPLALTLWRRWNFEPATIPDPPAAAGSGWTRGAYLVGGLGHCSACHGRRDAWGADGGPWDLRGGEIPLQGWYAPSLADPAEGALSAMPEAEALALLRDGRNTKATASGPMAVVVAHSLAHWREADLRAAVTFLRGLPWTPGPRAGRATRPPAADLLRQGRALYDTHCADCHGKSGEGVADDGPALAGNRAVALASPANVVKMVLGGGFGPSTTTHPRPPGMPPFATTLTDEEIAAVVSHVRWRFGLQASPVTALDVNRLR